MRMLDWVVLLAYFGGITLAGIYFARKNRSTEEYFLGNRSFPGWAIGLSMVGTSISSVTFLAYPGDAYRTAWLRMLPNFMLPVAVLVASIFFLPFFRQTGVTSAYEYLEGRFGPGTRLYAACVFIIGQVIRLSMILFLLSLLVHELTGLPVHLCILAGGIFVAFYTVAGGIEAVVWTDVAQTVVLVGGGIVCLAVIVYGIPGGLGEIISTAWADGKLQFADPAEDGSLTAVSWRFTLFERTALMMLFVGLTNWLAEYSANQNVVQRYCASKSTREARRAMWICAGSSVPIWAFYMFLGTSLYVYFKVNPSKSALAILTGEGGAQAERILPYFIIHYLPVGITGLVIAATLAAAMSSLDSSINAIATISVVDIYRRRLRPGKDDRHYLLTARLVAIAASAFMIGGAAVLAITESRTLQDTGTVLGALTAGGLLGLYMLGFFTTIGDGRAVGTGIGCTLLFTCWMALGGIGVLPETYRLPIDNYYTGIVGHVLMFLLGFALGCLLPKRERDLTNLTIWTRTAAHREEV